MNSRLVPVLFLSGLLPVVAQQSEPPADGGVQRGVVVVPAPPAFELAPFTPAVQVGPAGERIELRELTPRQQRRLRAAGERLRGTARAVELRPGNVRPFESAQGVIEFAPARAIRIEAVAHGRLGALVEPLDPQLRPHLGLAEPVGLLVRRVVPDSAAARLGIQDGDILVKLGEDRIVSIDQLHLLLGSLGETGPVSVEILRAGQRQTLQGQLDRLLVPPTPRIDGVPPATPPPVTPPAIVPSVGEPPVAGPRILGALVVPAEGGGLRVSRVLPASAASRAGVAADDILLELDGKALNASTDVRAALAAAGEGAELRLRRGTEERTVTLGFNAE